MIIIGTAEPYAACDDLEQAIAYNRSLLRPYYSTPLHTIDRSIATLID